MPTYTQVSCTTNMSTTARQQRLPDETTASRIPYANSTRTTYLKSLRASPLSLALVASTSRQRHVKDTSKTRQGHVRTRQRHNQRRLTDTSKTHHRHVKDTSQTRPGHNQRHVTDTSKTRRRHDQRYIKDTSKTHQRHVTDRPQTSQRSTEKTHQRSTELVLLSAFTPAPALLSPKNASSACPSSSTPQEVSAAS